MATILRAVREIAPNTAVVVDLNGMKISDDVEPRQTLADFLRDRCGLTATHLGCEHGACGACTVVMDGKATCSCLSLAVMCDGRIVHHARRPARRSGDELLRRHFHESHALQCGFCTPGMLITARDILNACPSPTHPPCGVASGRSAAAPDTPIS